MTDNELRLLMADSVQKCHRAVFDKYCNYVYTIAFSVLKSCGSREDVEECVSDVFVKIYRSYANGELRDGDLKGFVGAVAKHTSIDYMRKLMSHNKRNTSMDDENFPEIASDSRLEADTENKDRNRIIMEMVNSLGEPDSTIIVQQYFYERTAKEIANSIGMTAAAVQKRSVRAREKLKDMLMKMGIGKEAI